MEDTKYTRFRDIPLFTRKGTWECDYRLDDVVPQLDDWVANLALELDPDFQRIHVWKEEQQIAFIEFILKGGMTGRVIHLNNPQWGRGECGGEFVLVDGKQRVQAIRRFFNNEIPAYQSYRREYSDDTDLLRQGFKINVNNLLTRREVLSWYLEMNTGGTPHTAEEIAKARMLLEKEIGK